MPTLYRELGGSQPRTRPTVRTAHVQFCSFVMMLVHPSSPHMHVICACLCLANSRRITVATRKSLSTLPYRLMVGWLLHLPPWSESVSMDHADEHDLPALEGPHTAGHLRLVEVDPLVVCTVMLTS